MSIIKSGTTTTTAYSVDANTDGDLVFIVSESLTAMTISASGAVSFSSGGGFDIASANITNLTATSLTVSAATYLATASGNVGIGTTTVAPWSAGNRVVQVGPLGSVISNSSVVAFSCNSYYDGADKYVSNGSATDVLMASGDIYFRTAASGTANSALSWSTALTVNKDSGVKAKNTISVGDATPSTSGAGITFPATQSASSNANTLDDYEEGTWTPSIGGNATYNAQLGFYRKIGSLVYINAYLYINVKGTGSVNIISGLPFAANGASSQHENVFAVSKAEDLSVSVTSITLRNNGTDIYATFRTSASVSGIVNGSFITDSTELNFSGCYIAAN